MSQAAYKQGMLAWDAGQQTMLLLYGSSGSSGGHAFQSKIGLCQVFGITTSTIRIVQLKV